MWTNLGILFIGVVILFLTVGFLGIGLPFILGFLSAIFLLVGGVALMIDRD